MPMNPTQSYRCAPLSSPTWLASFKGLAGPSELVRTRHFPDAPGRIGILTHSCISYIRTGTIWFDKSNSHTVDSVRAFVAQRKAVFSDEVFKPIDLLLL